MSKPTRLDLPTVTDPDGDATLHIRCTREEKAFWTALASRAAQASGEKRSLAEWIKARLPDPPPRRER